MTIFCTHHNHTYMTICYIAMKIHIAEDTKAILDVIGGFITETRGAIEIKVRHLFVIR